LVRNYRIPNIFFTKLQKINQAIRKQSMSTATISTSKLRIHSGVDLTDCEFNMCFAAMQFWKLLSAGFNNFGMNQKVLSSWLLLIDFQLHLDLQLSGSKAKLTVRFTIKFGEEKLTHN
jgi:hypothetical protein